MQKTKFDYLIYIYLYHYETNTYSFRPHLPLLSEGTPIEAFYVNRKTLIPDYCCKACRSAACKKRYLDSRSVNDIRTYPLITDIKDRTLRMELILHARQVVNESVARKRRRLWETVGE